jgi:hypothetical protein
VPSLVRFFLVPLACLGSSGCLEFGKVDDAKQPGDLLGTYEVTAELAQSTCGTGAFGSTERWRFQVKLSRYERDLYWLNGREAIVGSIGKDDRSFSFDSRVDVDIPPEESGDAECRIRREDSASGKLSDEGVDVEEFDGELSFRYGIIDDSSCEGFLLSPGAPARLPCTIGYTMSAVRSSTD